MIQRSRVSTVSAILWIGGILLATAVWVDAEPITSLHPSNYVNDFAGVLDPATQARLNDLCRQVDQKTHAQIAVVTVKSTGRTSVGDYAHLLFNEWGIGNKGDNRGMLVLLSTKDRRYYTAVGSGFEPLFPNERVAGIGAEMIPDLRQRSYGKAVLNTVNEIAGIIAEERGVKLKGERAGSAP
jgi:uncharacterized protein